VEDKKAIYRLVIKEERKAQKLYRSLAKAMDKTDSSEIFMQLCKIEELHEESITNLFRFEFPDSELEINLEKLPKLDLNQALDTPQAALEFAISKEEKTTEVYECLADLAETDEDKALFLKFAKDEEGHKELLQAEMNRLTGSMIWFDESELNGMMEH